MSEQTLFGSGLDLIIKTGLIDVVLPFILFFAVIFGVLRKTDIFGKPSIDAAIAFAAALIITASIASIK